MENGVSGAPSSTSHQEPAGQSEFQFNTPAAVQLGIRRGAVFNNTPAKCLLCFIFCFFWLVGPLRGLLDIDESEARRLTFFILEYILILPEAVIIITMNAYNHGTVLIVWSTFTFIYFALLMNDVVGAWLYKNQPDSPKKDGFEGLYFLCFIFVIFYHAIVFLAFAIYLGHVVKAYKENERIRREEGALPPP